MSHTARSVAFALMLASLTLGCSMMHHEKEEAEKEGNETKVKMADLPAPVQQAFARESAGARKPIDMVDKETDKSGQTIYEADAVLADGKNYEIKIAPDGKVISKKVDNEEEEHEKK